MPALRARICLLILVLLPASGFAWGPIGHMAVDYVAYQQLTPAAKVRVRDLLKLNPDYSSWEKQIPAGTSASDHDMMIFMIAAIWADDIKGEPQYSDDGSDGGNTPDGTPSSQNTGYSDLLRHRYWHFVDIPFSSDHTPLPPIPVPNAQTQIVAFAPSWLLHSPANSSPTTWYGYSTSLAISTSRCTPQHASLSLTQRETPVAIGSNSREMPPRTSTPTGTIFPALSASFAAIRFRAFIALSFLERLSGLLNRSQATTWTRRLGLVKALSTRARKFTKILLVRETDPTRLCLGRITRAERTSWPRSASRSPEPV